MIDIKTKDSDADRGKYQRRLHDESYFPISFLRKNVMKNDNSYKVLFLQSYHD